MLETAEERGWIEPVELEAFALEHELADAGVEDLTGELERIGLEVRDARAEEKAEEVVYEAEQPSGAGDSLQLFLADVGRYKLLKRADRVGDYRVVFIPDYLPNEPGADVPVHYLFRGITPDRLLAYYRLADVCLVTPLRDGMNLVAKEFVTVQAAVDASGARPQRVRRRRRGTPQRTALQPFRPRRPRRHDRERAPARRNRTPPTAPATRSHNRRPRRPLVGRARTERNRARPEQRLKSAGIRVAPSARRLGGTRG